MVKIWVPSCLSGTTTIAGEVDLTPEQLAGEPGEPGTEGAKGSVLNTEYAQMQTYAFHTQTNKFEGCPSGKFSQFIDRALTWKPACC